MATHLTTRLTKLTRPTGGWNLERRSQFLGTDFIAVSYKLKFDTIILLREMLQHLRELSSIAVVLKDKSRPMTNFNWIFICAQV